MKFTAFQKFKLTLDRVILTGASLVLLASLILLFADGALFSELSDESLIPVGKFASSQQDVRRRVEHGLSWMQVKSKDRVYEGDSIFTGDESAAHIELESGGSLDVEPNSLVVIRTKGTELEVQLKYGSLQGKVDAERKIVLISDDGGRKNLQTDNSELRLSKSKSEKEAQLEVLKGQVSVQGKKGERQLVKKSEIATLSNEVKAEQVRKVDLEAPANGVITWLKPTETQVFRWKGDPELNYILELARDASFVRPILSREVHGTEHSVAVDDKVRGPMFWRLTSKPGEKTRVKSPARKVTLYPDVPPSLAAPDNEHVYSLDQPDSVEKVPLAWRDPAGSKEFHLQIAADQEFKDVRVDKTTNNSGYITPELGGGTYFWRVMGLHPQRQDPPWSHPREFAVRVPQRVPLNPPELINPGLSFMIPADDLPPPEQSKKAAQPKSLPAMSWKKTAKAKRYKVEIARSENFEKAVSQKVESAGFSLKAIKPGPLFWRVSTLSADSRTSPPSQIGHWQITVPAPKTNPVPKLVKKFTSESEYIKGTGTLALEWAPRTYAQQYELQVGMDAGFKIKKSFFVSTPSKRMTLNKSANLAWRVRALDQSKTPISEFSKPLKAEFEKIFEAPRVLAALPPAKSTAPAPAKNPPPAPGGPGAQNQSQAQLAGLVPPGLGSPELDFGNQGIPSPILNEPRLGTSVLSIRNSPVYLNFKWQATPGATSYRLQVSTTPDFRQVVSNTTTKRNHVLIEQDIPEGPVYWRVRAELDKDMSRWSQPNTFSVTKK